MLVFKLRPSAVRTHIIDCMEAFLVPMVSSSPGLGKSNIVAQIAKDFNLKLIDLRLSQCAPEDLMGLPMRTEEQKARFIPFDMFPIEGTPVPEGYAGWLLFLDEFNSAAKAVQAAAYKLALDRMVGQYKLHELCFVVAAGNLSTDRAITTDMSTAMQSRLVHLEMIADHDDFMENGHKAGFDNRVLSFLDFRPKLMHDFNPDHKDKTFACPRTWEFVSRLIKKKTSDKISPALIAGTVGEGAAIEFMAYLEEFANLPKYEDIVNKPDQVPMPSATGTRYAIMSMLLDKAQEKHMAPVMTFVLRFSTEFQFMFIRGLIQRNPSMRDNPEVKRNLKIVAKYLTDDTVAA